MIESSLIILAKAIGTVFGVRLQKKIISNQKNKLHLYLKDNDEKIKSNDPIRMASKYIDSGDLRKACYFYEKSKDIYGDKKEVKILKETILDEFEYHISQANGFIDDKNKFNPIVHGYIKKIEDLRRDFN